MWDTVLIEVERDFDLHAAIYGLPTGAHGRPHLPILHLREGFFFQAEAGTLDDDGVHYPPIGGDNDVEQHRSLILGFSSFVGILRLRAVDAHRRPDAVDASAEHSAARAAPFAGTKPAAGATADACTVAISKRIRDALRQRITPVRHIRTLYLQARRTEQGWIHRQFGVQIQNLCLRRSELRHRELGKLPL